MSNDKRDADKTVKPEVAEEVSDADLSEVTGGFGGRLNTASYGTTLNTANSGIDLNTADGGIRGVTATVNAAVNKFKR